MLKYNQYNQNNQNNLKYNKDRKSRITAQIKNSIKKIFIWVIMLSFLFVPTLNADEVSDMEKEIKEKVEYYYQIDEEIISLNKEIEEKEQRMNKIEETLEKNEPNIKNILGLYQRANNSNLFLNLINEKHYVVTAITSYNLFNEVNEEIEKFQEEYETLKKEKEALTEDKKKLQEQEEILESEYASLQQELLLLEKEKEEQKKIILQQESETKVENNSSYNDLILQAGISEEYIEEVNYIIENESGWDYTNTNPYSGAYGLCQAMPGEKMASAGSDWQTNPVTQLKWCSSYAESRYGGWNQAYDFWINNQWW